MKNFQLYMHVFSQLGKFFYMVRFLNKKEKR